MPYVKLKQQWINSQYKGNKKCSYVYVIINETAKDASVTKIKKIFWVDFFLFLYRHQCLIQWNISHKMFYTWAILQIFMVTSMLIKKTFLALGCSSKYNQVSDSVRVGACYLYSLINILFD